MESNNVTKILVYRYIFKVKDGEGHKLCVKYVSDVEEAHDDFQRALLRDANVLSALREYVCEIDCTLVGSVDHVKVEVPHVEVPPVDVVEVSEVLN